MLKNQLSILILIAIITLLPTLSWAQALPLPSGKHGIGHQRFEWTDTSRTEILGAGDSKRAVVADIWYPAKVSGRTIVPYLDTLAISRAFGENGLQSLLGVQGASVVRLGSIHTHAYENAAFAPSLRLAPVIFFSHGMGMITQVYTAQIEELVSHGYIVAALSHAYDAWLVSFSNGQYIPFESVQRTAAGNTEEAHIAYENKRIEWWAADIRFALDQLVAINNAKSTGIPFAGHMDFSSVGAMGHSSGGRAAARACQLDIRIKSCADQDGVAMMQPFYPDVNGVGMKQPFLLFERVRHQQPGEEDAASLGMTLQGLMRLVDSLRNKKVAALASTGGSFHVLLHFDSSSHMSFSDLPLMQAKDSAGVALAYRVLRVTCRYTREFFDKTLRGIAAPLYDGKERLDYIDLVQLYPERRSIK